MVANIGLYQIGWFTCLLQGGVIALLATVLILCLHFYLMVDGNRFKQEWQLVLKLLFVGLIVETIAINTGALVADVISDELAFFSWLPPLWLLCLWLLFSTTLSHGLAWLRQRLLLCAVLAAISAPSSYFAGAYLSPYMSLGDSTMLSLLTIGVLWALSFPLVMRYFVRL